MATRPATRSTTSQSAQPSGASTSAPSTAPKSQKQMSKAERRELQEQQRVAKAQAQAKLGVAPKGAKTSQAQSQSTPGQGSTASNTRTSQAAESGASSTRQNRAQDKPRPPQDAGDPNQNPPSRGIRIFSHFGLPKQSTSAVKGDIHPSIISVGNKIGSFKITGANARCIAMLVAFKSVIQDYVTPPHTTLSRHLSTHLSHQITYLVSLRPLSVTMGNAIRWLKVDISNSNIDLPEQEAKEELCDKIDTYIRDRIVVADRVIQSNALSKIRDGDVIMVYSRSSVVEKVVLHAHEEGKIFSVLVVDSRPMLEAKNLLSVLSSAGIQCTYLLLPALGSVIDQTTKVLLGAHSLHANGAVLSRAGTALIAMMASQRSKPVLVCCETYKFSETVPLDGFARNELAPQSLFGVDSELSIPSLQVMSPLYDLTPPQHITAVVTEAGVIPPNSISSLPFALGKLAL